MREGGAVWNEGLGLELVWNVVLHYFWGLFCLLLSDDGEGVEGSLKCKLANLQSRVAELEEELSLEKNRGEYYRVHSLPL